MPELGRKEALRDVLLRLQAGTRVVTITGPAGIGKTRLVLSALHAAVQTGERAWFVPLSEIFDAAGFVAAIGRAAGWGPDGPSDLEPLAEIAHRIAGAGPLLLALDECEHLTSVVASAVTTLADRAPNLRLLVASRERLRIEGESVLELAGLATSPDGPAVALLLQQLRAERPAYEPTPEERATLARIASCLDGIPLALEIAGSRLPVLGPEGLLSRLDRPFEVLRGRRRDVPARHQSLEAAVASSWALLSEAERATLAQCSVFCGFAVHDAMAVVEVPGADVVSVLEALRDKSLVVERAGRLGIYESIRAYARDRLDEAHARDATLDRMEAWFISRLAHATPDDHLNAVAVLDRAARRADLGPDAADRALGAILVAHETARPNPLAPSFLAAVGRVIALSPLDAPLLPEAHLVRLAMEQAAGRDQDAEADGTRAMELAGRRGDALIARRGPSLRGNARFSLGQLDDARTDLEAALAAHRAAGDTLRVADTLKSLGAVHQSEGDLFAARVCFEEALDLARSVGDVRLCAWVQASLGSHAHECELFDAARAAYEEALALATPLGDVRITSIASGYLGLLGLERGAADAQAHLDTAIEGARQRGNPTHEGYYRAIRSAVLAQAGRLVDAERDAAIGEELLAGHPVLSAVARIHRGHVALGHASAAALRADAFEAQRQRGLARAALDAATPALVERSDDARLARRILARAIEADPLARLHDPGAERLRGSLVVERDGSWFRADFGPRVILDRKPLLKQLLLAIVRAHGEHPGTSLRVEELLAIGWPGERLPEDILRNRLHVALVSLRKLGLRELLERTDTGYRIEPTAAVTWA